VSAVAERADKVYREQLDAMYRRRDQQFAWLLLVQWAFAIGLAVL